MIKTCRDDGHEALLSKDPPSTLEVARVWNYPKRLMVELLAPVESDLFSWLFLFV